DVSRPSMPTLRVPPSCAHARCGSMLAEAIKVAEPIKKCRRWIALRSGDVMICPPPVDAVDPASLFSLQGTTIQILCRLAEKPQHGWGNIDRRGAVPDHAAGQETLSFDD